MWMGPGSFQVPSDRATRHRLELRKFHENMRKIFTLGLTELWSRLHREVVETAWAFPGLSGGIN